MCWVWWQTVIVTQLWTLTRARPTSLWISLLFFRDCTQASGIQAPPPSSGVAWAPGRRRPEEQENPALSRLKSLITQRVIYITELPCWILMTLLGTLPEILLFPFSGLLLAFFSPAASISTPDSPGSFHKPLAYKSFLICIWRTWKKLVPKGPFKSLLLCSSYMVGRGQSFHPFGPSEWLMRKQPWADQWTSLRWHDPELELSLRMDTRSNQTKHPRRGSLYESTQLPENQNQRPLLWEKHSWVLEGHPFRHLE